jgi:hypothetical protein
MRLTDLLSQESLRLLDQTPSLTKKQDSTIFTYIAYLGSTEKKVFLRCLKDQNISMHTRYHATLDKVKKDAEQKAIAKRKKEIAEEKRKETKYASQPATKSIERIVKEINPELCGIFIVEGLYYKFIDLYISAITVYGQLSGSHHHGVAFPIFIDMLKKYKKHDTLSYTMPSGEICVLCRNQTCRTRYIEQRKSYFIEERTRHLSSGYKSFAHE